MLKFYNKKLKNNLTILIIKTEKLSTLDITLYINSGSVYENKNNNGISHLLEHLLFLKTKKLELPPVGLDIYPYTKKDFTYFEITTHKNLIKDALLSLYSVIGEPDFTVTNLKTIKKIVAEEIKEYGDSHYEVLNQKIDEFLYEKNSLALDITGNKTSLENISLSDLKEWYKKYYTPGNMILTLAGDIEMASTIKLIKKMFRVKVASNKAVKNKINKITYPRVISKPIELKSGTDFKQTYLAFVFPVLSINNPKYIHFILLAEILNKMIRQEMENSGLFYDIQLYYHHYLNTGEFRIITACEKTNIDKITKGINNFINTAKISKSYFSEIKKYLKYQFLLKEDNVDDLSSLTLYLLNNRPKLITLKDEINILNSIKYSDINTIKNKYFNRKNSYFFILD